MPISVFTVMCVSDGRRAGGRREHHSDPEESSRQQEDGGERGQRPPDPAGRQLRRCVCGDRLQRPTLGESVVQQPHQVRAASPPQIETVVKMLLIGSWKTWSGCECVILQVSFHLSDGLFVVLVQRLPMTTRCVCVCVQFPMSPNLDSLRQSEENFSHKVRYRSRYTQFLTGVD